jgi:hypothetical protein
LIAFEWSLAQIAWGNKPVTVATVNYNKRWLKVKRKGGGFSKMCANFTSGLSRDHRAEAFINKFLLVICHY